MTNSTPPLSLSIAAIKALVHRESRRVTSYDVATVAGVSQSAVSRCFKPGASVSKATYARVMKAAHELDYTPNAAARGLTTRRSNLVAVIVSAMASAQYPEVLVELGRQLALHGKRIVLFSMANEAELAPTLADLWQYQLDGAIVAARLSPGQVTEFERRGLPLVLFNRKLRDRMVHAIVCDQAQGARALVARLAAAGHKRFAVIDGPPDSSVAHERRHGIAQRLAELGLAAPLVVSGNGDYASGARGLREIIERLGAVPDAILCSNDLMAIGCLDTARHEMRLDVPGTLSITGCDGVIPSAWLSYNLTTLRQPFQSMAAAAVDMLTGLIGSAHAGPERRIFSATLIEGGTARLGPGA